MQDIALVVHNANRSGAKLSRFTHKSLHHRPVCKQEVIHRIWIQFCEMVVDFVGVFYFCNVFWRGKHTFSRQNSRHLLQRECVLLDSQRRINRSDAILAAQNRTCGKILGGTTSSLISITSERAASVISNGGFLFRTVYTSHIISFIISFHLSFINQNFEKMIDEMRPLFHTAA